MAKRRQPKKMSRKQNAGNPEEGDVPNIIEEPLRVISVGTAKAKKRKPSGPQKTRRTARRK